MENKLKFYSLLALFGTLFLCENVRADGKSWTWSHKKVFSKKESLCNRKKNELVFEKRGVPLFSQLIFSWNALRPKKGSFIFYCQAKDAATNQWGKWHKMFEWGENIQRSFFSGGEKTKYVYVRLESLNNNLCDGFRVKMEPRRGADLAFLKGFFVCTSYFKKFRFEAVGEKIVSLPSVLIKNVPKKSQRVLDHPESARLCSPTSCSMLSEFFAKKRVDPIDFAGKSFDQGLDDYGSWPFNVAHAFEECKGNVLFYTSRMNSFFDLHKKLTEGLPVVVSVRGYIEGGQKVYRNGHLLVVVGWDSKRKRVICQDPAFFSNKKVFVTYKIKSFLRAWEKSRRLAYVPDFGG